MATVNEVYKLTVENREALNKINEEEELKHGKETESDTEFHLAIANASHNFVFTNIIRLHLDLLKGTREKTQQIPGRREERWREHQAILQAIKEHNAKKAGETMLKHLKNVREVLVKI